MGASVEHEMPFGPRRPSGGGVEFRLWAPGADRVEVVLGDGRHALERGDDGFWRGLVPGAGVGTEYAFAVDGRAPVPDPASRMQRDDVHGPSVVVDPAAYAWRRRHWAGRDWSEAVVYEIHVGAFTAAGTFEAAARRLDTLRDLGVTALQLMPVADFPGRRNWGYDGVLPFAPDRAYGTPDDLKALVDAAHERGIMVLLDVVYNHLGPDGNALWAYAPEFFDAGRSTPWGAPPAFDGPQGATVREFFLHNALYWIEEFRIDGLRLDAVHAIHDGARPELLAELARRVATGPGRDRAVHLIAENDANEATLLERDADGRPRICAAQWNDDLHHALHVLVTGESGGYYGDFADRPAEHLARALAEGFAYQGEPSAYRDGVPRGEPSGHLPPTAFLDFLQNHDQVGNRAFGERLTDLVESDAALHVAAAIVLLAPAPPMIFMGEEIGCRQPFPFFCDHEPELAARIAASRSAELAAWPEFAGPAGRAEIPDPNAESTFRMAVLHSLEPMTPEERRWRARYRDMLAVRRDEIVPRLPGTRGGAIRELAGDTGLEVRWRLGDGAGLVLRANPGPTPATFDDAPRGDVVYRVGASPFGTRLEPWSLTWSIDAADAPSRRARAAAAEADDPAILGGRRRR